MLLAILRRAALGLLVPLGGAQAGEVKEVTYQQWPALEMTNGETQVTIAPALGGRIIQYTFRGHEFLYWNPALAGRVLSAEAEDIGTWTWQNYGGDKLWPAPQGWSGAGEWPGPDKMIEDQVPFEAQVVSASGPEVRVDLLGPRMRNWSGLQFSRSLVLRDASARLDIVSTIRNVSAQPQTWSVWAVTQIAAGDAHGRARTDLRVVAPLNPASVFPRGFEILYGQANHPSFTIDRAQGLFVATFTDRVGKAGLDSSGGWAALIDEGAGLALIQRFVHNPAASYPDRTSFTVWLNAPGSFIAGGEEFTLADEPAQTPRYVEMELLSPLVRLLPGQSYSCATSWEALAGGLPEVLQLCRAEGR